MHCATNYISSTTTHVNPVPVWSNNRCWQYWGQIYLPAGTTTFGADIDDNSQLKIDGATVFTQSGNYKISGTVSFGAPGWHDFLFTCGNGGGAAGPWGGTGLEQQTIGGVTVGVGFGMKLPGETIWSFPADPGDRSLFRYDDGLGFDDSFTIAGVPANIGEPTPAYGVYSGVANGSNLTMSVASGTGYVAVSDTQRACCTGYVWYAVDVGTSTKTVVQSGGDTSFAYSHSNMAEVVWHWKVENLVTVAAGAGGSVSTNGGWGDYIADTITITATPSEGYSF